MCWVSRIPSLSRAEGVPQASPGPVAYCKALDATTMAEPLCGENVMKVLLINNKRAHKKRPKLPAIGGLN